MTIKDLIKSPLLWVVSGSYLVTFASKTALTDWGHIFLIEQFGQSQLQGKLVYHYWKINKYKTLVIIAETEKN